MISKMNASVCFVVVFLTLRISSSQNTCANKHAFCINIRNCQPVIDILRVSQKPLQPETLQFLRDLQCGRQGEDPMVCCLNQTASTMTVMPPTVRLRENIPNPPNVTNHTNLRLLNHRICGPDPNLARIMVGGGNKARINEFPWMALIAYDIGMMRTDFRCGGTIISERYVLTAAHCVTMLPSGLKVIGVRVGEYDISTDPDCVMYPDNECSEDYQEYGIDNINFHPQYSPTNMHNDIALIKLNDSIDFRPRNVKPICLPLGTTAILQHDRVIITGWGTTEFGIRSNELLKANIPVVSNRHCQEMFKNFTIWYKQMCAGGENNMNSCNGDSGGPLQALGLYNNKIRMIQYGVISYSLKNCGTAGFPGVYTRVSHYMDWILDTMKY